MQSHPCLSTESFPNCSHKHVTNTFGFSVCPASQADDFVYLCLHLRMFRHLSFSHSENASVSSSIWEGNKAEMCSQAGAAFSDKQRNDQFCSQCSMWKVNPNPSGLLALHSESWRNCSEDDAVAVKIHQQLNIFQ